MSDIESMIQFPLAAEYKARLVQRAKSNDRVAGREAAHIVKDVLDGKYARVVEFPEPGAPVEMGGAQ